MSTKIHEGLRIDLPQGKSVFDIANQLRTIITEEIRKESIQYNAELIRKRLRTTEEGSSYLDHLVLSLRKDEDEWGNFDIGFFLYEPDHKEFLLAIPFGRGSAHYKRALEVPGISEWGYWDADCGHAQTQRSPRSMRRGSSRASLDAGNRRRIQELLGCFDLL